MFVFPASQTSHFSHTVLECCADKNRISSQAVIKWKTLRDPSESAAVTAGWFPDVLKCKRRGWNRFLSVDKFCLPQAQAVWRFPAGARLCWVPRLAVCSTGLCWSSLTVPLYTGSIPSLPRHSTETSAAKQASKPLVVLIYSDGNSCSCVLITQQAGIGLCFQRSEWTAGTYMKLVH